LFHLSFFYS